MGILDVPVLKVEPVALEFGPQVGAESPAGTSQAIGPIQHEAHSGPLPAGPTQALPERLGRWRKIQKHDCADFADVEPLLERAGRHHAGQRAGGESSLDSETILGFVARAVGQDPGRILGLIHLGVGIGTGIRVRRRSGPVQSRHNLLNELAGVGKRQESTGAVRPQSLQQSYDGVETLALGLPEEQHRLGLAPGSILGWAKDPGCATLQGPQEGIRLTQGSRAGDQPMARGCRGEPSQEVRGIGPEDAIVDVCLVQDKEPEGVHELDDRTPAEIAHEPGMSHVRRHDDDIGLAQDVGPRLCRHPTIDVPGRAPEWVQDRFPLGDPVLDQRTQWV